MLTAWTFEKHYRCSFKAYSDWTRQRQNDGVAIV